MTTQRENEDLDEPSDDRSTRSDLLPWEQVAIAARFDGFRGRYVFHCHNLEHEDMAMMSNFVVT